LVIRLDDGRRHGYLPRVLPTLNQIIALVFVVGMAAAALPVEQRRRAILVGIGAATVLRILFASIALRLLAVIGLGLAGGLLLLWVAWKLYRELRRGRAGKAGLDTPSKEGTPPSKTTGQAVLQIVVADLSMSLDNVLAVAGVARTQAEPWVLFLGLGLSVALMGVASSLVARLLARHFWLSWLGLAIIAMVALRMIWAGGGEVLGHVGWM
jgi:YjbE family integral membrane protein